MRFNVEVMHGAVHRDTCRQIIEKFKPRLEQAKTFNGAEKDGYRRSRVAWIEDEFELQQYILNFGLQANGKKFNVDISPFVSELQFTEYTADVQGCYKEHHDVNWDSDENNDRKLSMIIQLSESDDYEGGDLRFTEILGPDAEFIKEIGTVIIFPSYLRHEVLPVTKGTRYSLVSWIRGPRWR